MLIIGRCTLNQCISSILAIGDRMENILWECDNLPSFRYLQNVIIKCGKKCGKKNVQYNSVEDVADEIVEVALALRRKYHPIAIFVSGILSRDDNW